MPPIPSGWSSNSSVGVVDRCFTTWKEMGRNALKRKKKFQVGKNPKSARVEAKDTGEKRGYRSIVKENEVFFKYYQGQGLVPEMEWDRFLSTMRSNLPMTFRITGTRLLAESVLACLERRYFHELMGLEVEGEKIDLHPLEWYPNRLAWHLSLSRPVVRKSPLLSQFHSFLVRENEQGHISRQEGVSMIPPLLLGVEPGHHVLDMCAAPGSKTAQLIEALHSSDGSVPDGVVIANDADNKRCYMLVHQAKRLNSPSFMVTNHDASTFPNLYYHDEQDVRHTLHYERVLCDVPCSGDGTMRKNPMIWKTWNPGQGLSLHRLQLRILVRGLELLAPGGRLVYSTCSLNPIEDEAVICTALKVSRGTVTLVDCSNELQGLRRANGVSEWKVMSKQGEWVLPPDANKDPTSCSAHSDSHLQSTMFPPTPEEAVGLHLDRCIRILPHLQDTGGFFVAVLEKSDWLPWQLEAQAKRRREKSGNETRTDSGGEEKNLGGGEEKNLGGGEEKNLGGGEEKNLGGGEEKNLEGGEEKNLGGGEEKNLGGGEEKNLGRGEEKNLGGGEEKNLGGGEGGSLEEGTGQGQEEMEYTNRPNDILGKPGFSKKSRQGFREDPFVFLEGNEEIITDFSSFYGLPSLFPGGQLMTRTHSEKKNSLYLTSSLVKELTLRNEKRCKIINIGVKVLSRADHPKSRCRFRLTQEGMETMRHYISEKIVPIELEDLVKVLSEANPLTSSLSPLAQKAIEPIGFCPALFVYTPPEKVTSSPGAGIPLKCPISLSGWIGPKSVRLFVAVSERCHYLSILGHEPPEKLSLATVGRGRREKDEEVEEGGDDDSGTEILAGQEQEEGNGTGEDGEAHEDNKAMEEHHQAKDGSSLAQSDDIMTEGKEHEKVTPKVEVEDKMACDTEENTEGDHGQEKDMR